MKKKELPKLPQGQGTFSYTKDRISFRKIVTDKRGNKVRKTVYGKTIKECLEKMAECERGATLHGNTIRDTKTLEGAMREWAETQKKPKLKLQSYSRIETVINTIATSEIGQLNYQTIRAEELQEYLAGMNEDNKALATITIYYTYLNAFYKYASKRYCFENPMEYVVMYNKHTVSKEKKEIQWFDSEDIKKFLDACTSTYANGKRRFTHGNVFAANIFMGLRIGELCALQWKDIDFDKKTVYVYKTTVKVGGTKIQNSTKKDNKRYVPLNQKAIGYLKAEYERGCLCEPDDFVMRSRVKDGNVVSSSSMQEEIKRIEEVAKTKVQDSGTHIMRHTCASLFFKNEISVEVIAKILGHSPEVCRSIYVHFYEEQLKEAVNKIENIEI